MTYANWRATTDPKVFGAWNIHKALVSLNLQRDLDFLLLISSISGFIGQIGQANYAAANTFLDAFSQYCQTDGLPCATIDLGVVEDVGYVSHNPRLLSQFRQMACHVLRERDVLEAMQLMVKRAAALKAERMAGRKLLKAGKEAIEGAKVFDMEYVNKLQLGLGFRSTEPLSSPTNRTAWKRDLSVAQYYNIESRFSGDAGPVKSGPESSTGKNNEALRNFLQEAALEPSYLTTEEAHTSLARLIQRTLNAFLRRQDDDGGNEENKGDRQLSEPLSALGLDSLVAVELRNWFRQTLGAEVSVMQIMEAGSLKILGKEIAGRMKEKYAAVDNGKSPGVNGVNGVNGHNRVNGVNGTNGSNTVNGTNGTKSMVEDIEVEKVLRGEEWTVEGQLKMP